MTGLVSLDPTSGSVGTVTKNSFSKGKQPGDREDCFPEDTTGSPEPPEPAPLPLHPPLSAVLLGMLKQPPLQLSTQKKAIPSPCTWCGIFSALTTHCYFVYPFSILFMGEGCTFLCIGGHRSVEVCAFVFVCMWRPEAGVGSHFHHSCPSFL